MMKLIAITLVIFHVTACKPRQNSKLSEVQYSVVVEPEQYDTFANGVSALLRYVDQHVVIEDTGTSNFGSRMNASLNRIPPATTPLEQALTQYRLMPFRSYLFPYLTSSHNFDLPEKQQKSFEAINPDLLRATWSNKVEVMSPMLQQWNQERTRNNLPPVIAAKYHSTISRADVWTMLVPSPRQDIWLQFNRTFGGLLVIFVDKTRYTPDIYFSIKPIPPSKTRISMSNHCVSCHKSGYPLFIFNRGHRTPELDKMNQYLARYTTPGRTPAIALPPVDMPGIGLKRTYSLTEMRTLLRTNDVTPQQHNTLNDYAQCSTCHDGQNRAKLLPPFGLFVSRSIDWGHMPPESTKLDAVTAQLLKNLLILDYREQLKAWLKGDGMKQTQPSPDFTPHQEVTTY